jgi:hypothetical protein
MLMLWQTREHAELPLRERGPAFLQALGSIMEISTGPNSLWQVNAASRDWRGWRSRGG